MCRDEYCTRPDASPFLEVASCRTYQYMRNELSIPFLRSKDLINSTVTNASQKSPRIQAMRLLGRNLSQMGNRAIPKRSKSLSMSQKSKNPLAWRQHQCKRMDLTIARPVKSSARSMQKATSPKRRRIPYTQRAPEQKLPRRRGHTSALYRVRSIPKRRAL